MAEASSFSPHMSILPPAQRKLWPELRPSVELGLVLYGGTAISLRLGHRISLDFDFFTERALDKEALARSFPFLKTASLLQDQPNSLTVEVSTGPELQDRVKIQFFGNIGFGRVGVPAITFDGVLCVASLDDLMATKVKVIMQRVEHKDYSDIAVMINAGVSLEKGLAAATEMYKPTFQPTESLKALVYFEGGDLHLLSENEKNTLITASQAVRRLPIIALVPGLSTTTGM